MIRLISEAEPAIVKQIVHLERETFGPGGLNEWHLVPLIRHGRGFVAQQGLDVIGSIQYMLDWDRPKRAYMVGVSVAQAARGQGLGTTLLAESLAAIQEDGIEEVELTVEPENLVAVNLYKNKFDFVVSDFRSNEYGCGKDRLIMKKSLDSSPAK